MIPYIVLYDTFENMTEQYAAFFRVLRPTSWILIRIIAHETESLV